MAYVPRDARPGRPNAGEFSHPETGELNDTGLELVRRAAGLGLTRAATARLLGMCDKTFVERRKKFPIIDEVFETGKAEANLQVANALFKRAVSGDMAAIRWYEMTRTERNPNAPLIESDEGNGSYLIAAPPKASREEWVKEHSPVVIEHDPSPEAA